MDGAFIREAEEKDIPEIISMTLDFERYLIYIDDTLVQDVLPPERYEKVLREGLFDEKHRFFVIEKDSELIGYADYWAYPEFLHGGISAYLHNLYIIEGHRGKGHGTAMVKLIMDEAKMRGAVAIHVPVKTKNVKAMEFYRKRGIETVFSMMETIL